MKTLSLCFALLGVATVIAGYWWLAACLAYLSWDYFPDTVPYAEEE